MIDVLREHCSIINIAGEHISRVGRGNRIYSCIVDLAAGIGALQTRVAELEKEHPVFVAAVAWATGREPFASATLEEAVDDYREETKL